MKEAAPLLTHLIELRNRLVWCVGVLFVAIIACYFVSKDIYSLLVEPLAKAMEAQSATVPRRLIYTDLTEAFFTYMGVAVWSGFFITAPFILIQIWRFMAPGLYANEKNIIRPYLFLTPLLFYAGAAAAYYLVFPAAWHFFLSFETGGGAAGLPIQLEARVGDYLNLSMSMMLAFGFAFELPLALILLVHLGIVGAAQLRQFRRYAVVINFVLAAVITPPDVISQLALAIPLCLLYEVAIMIATMIDKKKAHLSREVEKV
ncbi:MAG: twin-arginine translocase subunit TatC [Alphaproteobacteria bacterium]|nr:twin-arginine translocase subunit TatC [Alphaproteobacteria bacterium]